MTRPTADELNPFSHREPPWSRRRCPLAGSELRFRVSLKSPRPSLVGRL